MNQFPHFIGIDAPEATLNFLCNKTTQPSFTSVLLGLF